MQSSSNMSGGRNLLKKLTKMGQQQNGGATSVPPTNSQQGPMTRRRANALPSNNLNGGPVLTQQLATSSQLKVNSAVPATQVVIPGQGQGQLGSISQGPIGQIAPPARPTTRKMGMAAQPPSQLISGQGAPSSQGTLLTSSQTVHSQGQPGNTNINQTQIQAPSVVQTGPTTRTRRKPTSAAPLQAAALPAVAQSQVQNQTGSTIQSILPTNNLPPIQPTATTTTTKSKKRGRKGKNPKKVVSSQGDDEEEEKDEKENKTDSDGDDDDPSLPFTLKSRKKLKLLDTIDDDNDGNSNVQSTSKGKGNGKKGQGPSIASSKTAAAAVVEVEVDVECVEKFGRAKVFSQGEVVYSAMLNQANIQQNNNKFFVLQVLEESNGTYSTWFRWGRVGFKGQSKLIPCGVDVHSAIRHFEAKFREKTGNAFSDRAVFQKQAGKYDLIEVTKADNTKQQLVAGGSGGGLVKTIVRSESKLEPRLQHLMELICDIKAMERDVRRMDFDVQRSPLGKITKAQLKAGFESLTRIEHHIMEGRFDQDFHDSVNEYYTRIPHNFRMRPPPLITSLEQLKVEIELLETLAGIEIAVTAMSREAVIEEESHLDQRFRLLRYAPRAMAVEEPMFELINNYLQWTHGGTHGAYKMAIRHVYELMEVGGGKAKKRGGAGSAHLLGLGNRRLLWHGSRLTNWFGILTQGLRIAPPEAPVTGYMFGKGVYFADASSKSANYTFPERGQPGLLVLAEVALGEVEERLQADQYLHERIPPGKQSVKGVGQNVPESGSYVTLPDGVLVPCGKLVQNKMKGSSPSLLYNEYIVYNTAQIRERYLVEVDFQFTY